MDLKKTVFSNISWVLYSLVVLVFSFLAFTSAASGLHVDAGIGLLWAVLYSVLSVLAVCLITRKKRRSEEGESTVIHVIDKHVKRALAVSCHVLSGIFLAFGIYQRVRFLFVPDLISQIENGALIPFYPYENVVPDGVSEYIYYSLLEVLFFIFGNYAQIIIILNLVLTVLNVVILFIALKRLLGGFAAMSVTGFLCIPVQMVRTCLYQGHEYLSLVFMSLALLFLSEFLPFKKSVGRSVIIPVMLFGLFAGLYAATDTRGFGLMSALLCIFMKERSSGDSNERTGDHIADRVLVIIPAILVSLAGYACGHLIYSQISGESYISSLFFVLTHFDVFGSKVLLSDHISPVIGLLLSALAVPGIIAGFLRKISDQGTVLALLLFGFAAADFAGLPGICRGMGLSVLILLAAASGHTVENLIMRNKCPGLTEEEIAEIRKKKRNLAVPFSEHIPEAKEDDMNLFKRSKDNSMTEEQTVSSANFDDTVIPDKKTRPGEPLENPLPVPERKNVHSKMDYDYYVSDKADYDY